MAAVFSEEFFMRTIAPVMLTAALVSLGMTAAQSSCTPAQQSAARTALAVTEFACSALPNERDRALCLAGQNLAEAIADCIAARSPDEDAGAGAGPSRDEAEIICARAAARAAGAAVELDAVARDLPAPATSAMPPALPSALPPAEPGPAEPAPSASALAPAPAASSAPSASP